MIKCHCERQAWRIDAGRERWVLTTRRSTESPDHPDVYRPLIVGLTMGTKQSSSNLCGRINQYAARSRSSNSRQIPLTDTGVGVDWPPVTKLTLTCVARRQFDEVVSHVHSILTSLYFSVQWRRQNLHVESPKSTKSAGTSPPQ